MLKRSIFKSLAWSSSTCQALHRPWGGKTGWVRQLVGKAEHKFVNNMPVILRRDKCYEKIKHHKGTEKAEDRRMGRDLDKTWWRHPNSTPNM